MHSIDDDPTGTREPTDLLARIYAQWAVEMDTYADMSVHLLRMIFDDWQRAAAEPEAVTYRHTAFGGVPGIMATPADVEAGQALLVLHGGGFALGSSASHRKLAGHLARSCRSSAFVADFRLAPEHPYPAGRDDALAAFDGLLEAGYREVTPVGDSAGANLAISTVLARRDAGKSLPKAVVTISPWLNMENTGATLESNDATDFLITRAGLQANIDRYLGETADPTDPLVNPLYADFGGFPPLYVCASDTESLYDDSVQLHRLATKHGVGVRFSLGNGMQHVYPMLAGNHPRADAEIEAIAGWLARL